MTIKELVNSVESVNYLSGLKLPIAVSFRLSGFLKEMAPIIDTYNEAKNTLLKELGEPIKDKDGKETGNYKFKTEEDGNKFIAEMKTLEDEESDLKVPDIKLTDLGSVEIEPKYLINLIWLIKE